MKVKTIILGGGIAGLIWAYYNEGVVVSPEFGGQMASHFNLGPRFLHKTEYAERFLEELDIKYKLKTIKVGYCYNGELFSQIPNQKFIDEYYKKSRGIKDENVKDPTAMSGKLESFEALIIDFNEIINKLVSKLDKEGRLLESSVTAIDIYEKVIIVNNGMSYSYDNLVNTMPLNVFSELLIDTEFHKPEEFKCSPITYVLVRDIDRPIVADGFDYIYMPDEDVPHHRITLGKETSVLDWFGHHTKEGCIEKYKDKFIDCRTLWNAQILPFDKPIGLPNVKFVGRYGTWNRSWKTEKVIEEAFKNKEKVKYDE